jgi:hypothetical protein
MNRQIVRPIICKTNFSEPAQHAANVAVLAATMGAVAQEVIARSCRPVLLVRPPLRNSTNHHTPK